MLSLASSWSGVRWQGKQLSTSGRQRQAGCGPTSDGKWGVAKIGVWINNYLLAPPSCFFAFLSPPPPPNHQGNTHRQWMCVCVGGGGGEGKEGAHICVNLCVSWVGLFKLQPDFRIQLSFRKAIKWLYGAFWVSILTFQDSDLNLVSPVGVWRGVWGGCSRARAFVWFCYVLSNYQVWKLSPSGTYGR